MSTITRNKIWMTVTGLLFVLFSNAAWADSNSLGVQGFVDDGNGAPLQGEYQVTLRFYGSCDDSVEDAVVEQTGTVDIIDGFYSTSIEVDSDTISQYSEPCLGVQFENDSEMSPRVEYYASPYSKVSEVALQADVADVALALDGSAFGSGVHLNDDNQISLDTSESQTWTASQTYSGQVVVSKVPADTTSSNASFVVSPSSASTPANSVFMAVRNGNTNADLFTVDKEGDTNVAGNMTVTGSLTPTSIKAGAATLTSTELSYLDGATSNLQAQINAIGVGGIDQTANYTWTGIHNFSGGTVANASPFVFEGATADAFETTFVISDPTADRTITFQNLSGTVAYLSDISGKLGTTLADGKIFIGSAGNVATAQSMSGDATITNAGVLTIAANAVGSSEISNGSVDGNDLNASVSGNGLTGGGGSALAVGAGTGITVNANDVAINLNANLSWTGTHSFASANLSGDRPLVLDGATANANRLTLAVADPDAGRTQTFQNADGTIALLSDITTATTAKLGNTLASGKIFVGSAGNIATAQTMGGDATMANDGTLTIAADAVGSSEIANGSVDGNDLNASVAGNGLAGGGGSALAIGAGAGITVNANDIAVNTTAAFTPTWGGLHTFGNGLVVGTNKDITFASGTGTLNISNSVTNASDNAISISPSFTGGATDNLIYSIFNIQSFTANNAAGTDTVRAFEVGPLTETVGANISSAVMRVGAGWDTVLDLNGTTISATELGLLDGASTLGDITDVTAGNGLTGGASSGNATVDVGAGTGITVNANDVAVNTTGTFTPTWGGKHTFGAGIDVSANQDINLLSGSGSINVTNAVTNAADSVIKVSPSFTGGATDNLVYDVIRVDNITAVNAAGIDTINSFSIGNMTDPGATINSTAINIGTGWDTALNIGSGGISGNSLSFKATGTSVSFSVPNSQNPAFSVTEGSNNYIQVMTGDEEILLGNPTTNPNIKIVGSGGLLSAGTGTTAIGNATNEFGNIYVADGVGLNLGSDQDGLFAFDNSDGRVELTGTNAGLYIEDKLSLGRQQFTMSVGGAATENLTVAASYVEVMGADNNADVVQVQTTNAKLGDLVFIMNSSPNTIAIDATPSTKLSGGADVQLTQFDIIMLLYDGANWMQVGSVVNNS